MINWTDTGIVLSSRKYGEKYKIVDIFTKNHGKYSAMVSLSKTSSFSNFSNIEVDYSSKTESSLGFWRLKSEKQNWIFSINSINHIQVCQGITYILNKVLPYGVCHNNLFDITNYISNNMHKISNKDILTVYAYFELVLLNEIGLGSKEFELNLNKFQTAESQINNLLVNKNLSQTIQEKLKETGKIIGDYLQNIDNYYRSSIIRSLAA